MRKGHTYLAALTIGLVTAFVAAAPAAKPDKDAEIAALRAENARLRAELARLAPSPTTRPATQPAGKIPTIDECLAVIPAAIAWPDQSGSLGGENPITKQRFERALSAALVGKTISVQQCFTANFGEENGKIPLQLAAGATSIGGKRIDVVANTDSTVPAAAADSVLALKKGDVVTVVGKIKDAYARGFDYITVELENSRVQLR